VVFIAFAVIAAIAVGKTIVQSSTHPLFADTDDAMRMVTVRDLLAGQGWYDHLQHRLNAPFGAEIHWSHLVDAAIGGLVLLFRPLAGSQAETLAACAWPLLLLLGLLVLSSRLAYRLAGRAAILPAVVLPAVSPAVMAEFSPGRIDHHSIQILLTLMMAWGAIEAIERPRFALIAGLAAALSLAIGIEGLPAIVCAILAVALTWVMRPRSAAGMAWFSLGFAPGTLAMLALAYPPNRWLEPACDVISPVYAASAAGTGVVLVLLSILPLERRPAWQRLALGAGAGGVLALGLATLFPACLRGPYAALDPWLVHHWLDEITEAKPLWQSLASLFDYTLAIAVPPMLGLVAVGIRLWREPADRGAWAILGLFLAVAVAVMDAQIRGARLAMPLAVPAAAWVILVARGHYLAGRRVSGALAMIGGWSGFAGMVILVGVALATLPFADPARAVGNDSDRTCRMPAAFAGLARLPPQRVMTPIDLGSHLLLHTPHAVVAAPYHRDQAGVLDALHFFNGPIDKGRAILAARGITLVAVCPGMPELDGLPDAASDSFVKLFAAGRLPSWLQPISPPGATIEVFRVLGQ
jgi:hypothetical protein